VSGGQVNGRIKVLRKMPRIEKCIKQFLVKFVGASFPSLNTLVKSRLP
jgi:hypothetical protein